MASQMKSAGNDDAKTSGPAKGMSFGSAKFQFVNSSIRKFLNQIHAGEKQQHRKRYAQPA